MAVFTLFNSGDIKNRRKASLWLVFLLLIALIASESLLAGCWWNTSRISPDDENPSGIGQVDPNQTSDENQKGGSGNKGSGGNNGTNSGSSGSGNQGSGGGSGSGNNSGSGSTPSNDKPANSPVFTAENWLDVATSAAKEKGWRYLSLSDMTADSGMIIANFMPDGVNVVVVLSVQYHPTNNTIEWVVYDDRAGASNNQQSGTGLGNLPSVEAYK